MINIRKTRAMLWLGTAGLLCVVATIVGLHLAFPPVIDSAQRDTTSPIPKHQTDDRVTVTRIDPVSLQRVASKDIRQQLFDPPIQAVKPPPPKPLPQIELISTIIGDNGQHRAWVRDGQALRKIVAGDTLGPSDNMAVVESIEVDHLVIRHEAKRVEVSQQATSGGRR